MKQAVAGLALLMSMSLAGRSSAQPATAPSTQPALVPWSLLQHLRQLRAAQIQPAPFPDTQPVAAPDTRPSAQTLARVEALVAQLSDRQWKTRQQAQDGLVMLGEAAAERLKRLVKETTDEEARTRAESALAQIAANDRSGPTLLTLHLKQVPLGVLIGEIARQARTDINIWPPLEQQPNAVKVSIDADRKPFWEVVREVSRQTGLSPERMGNSNRITLMNTSGRWTQKPSAMHGCYLVVAESANLSHNVDYAQPQNVQSSFGIQFRVYVDPKVRILRGTPQLHLEEVVDDKGNDLAPPGVPPAGYSPSWGARWMWDLSAILKFQPNLGTRIARFRGSARFIVQSRGEVWEVGDLLHAKDVEHAMPLGKYTLKSFTKSGANTYSAQITADLKAADNRGQMFQTPLLDMSVIQQGICVVDAQGRTLTSGGGGGGANSRTHAQYSLSFYQNNEMGVAVGEPARLIWDIPLETENVTVPISMDGLPIP